MQHKPNHRPTHWQFTLGGLFLATAVAGMMIVLYKLDRQDEWEAEDRERRGQALLEAIPARLEDVPLSIGDWVGSESDVADAQIEARWLAGVRSLSFRHKETDAVVHLLIVAGNARHVAIHTPEWSWNQLSMTMESEPVQTTVNSADDADSFDFMTSTFLVHDGEQETTTKRRILWSYSDESGTWTSPRWPKPHFAGRPALFKVYLTREITDEEPIPLKDDATVEFASVVMPALTDSLFPDE